MTTIPNELKALPSKQQKFVLAYIETQNGTESCRRAGYKGKDPVLGVQSTRLLKNAKVQAAMAAITEPLVKKQLVTVEEIIAELKDIGMADWRDMIEVKYDKEGSVVSAQLKLSDKVKALQLLGDHAGAWKDQTVNLKHFNLGALLNKADAE